MVIWCRYAFTIACFLEHVPKVALHKQMMAQPPWDSGQLHLSTNTHFTVSRLPHLPREHFGVCPSVCDSAKYDNWKLYQVCCCCCSQVFVHRLRAVAEMEPFYLMHFTYGCDYNRKVGIEP